MIGASITGQRLGATQLAVMAIHGAVLWLGAVFLTAALGDAGLLTGTSAALIYAATVPGTVPFVWLARRIGRLAPQQLLPGYAIGTAAALVLDGLAVAFFRPLYGDDPTGAAAVILWGAGVGIVLSLMLDRR